MKQIPDCLKILAAILFLAAGSQLLAEEQASNPFFAMDTGLRDGAHQTAESQVALVKETGFAGIGPSYSSPEALKQMLAELDRQGLKMYSLYINLNIDDGASINSMIKDAAGILKGRDTVLWLNVTSRKFKPSDTAGDESGVTALRAAADVAQEAGLRVSVYPHAGFWVERVDDAVRLVPKVDRKNFGVTFNLCHWLKVDGKDAEERIKKALPYLSVVTINGADKDGKEWDRLIQPLDTGTFDVGGFVKMLKALGYKGPIGLQHFGIRGDSKKNLQRSMDGWRKISETPVKSE